jgi:peroxiredoxin
MKRTIIKNSNTLARVIGLVLLFSALLSSCNNEGEEPAPDLDPDNPGSLLSAPDFELNSVDGKTVKLADFSDKVVVLFFFGNTCPSCRAVAPDIEKELNLPYEGRDDYAIIGLDQWDGNSNSVMSFQDNTMVSFPLLLNASGVARAYDTTYDRLLVIDKNGKIALKGRRGATNDVSIIKSKVDELLN